MLHTKSTATKPQRPRGLKLLTKNELTEIRSHLPRSWRLLINEKHAGISVRQITEVFNQRTKNVDENLVVWSTINDLLANVRDKKVKENVSEVFFYWQNSYNVIHPK